MAVKKSELYRSLWSSCDELRGGMDASQYKDYVLTLLFVKYVSDKYAGKQHAMIEVPEYGGFEDMVRLRGDKDIGEEINKIIRRLADANDLRGVIDIADFNDEDKLGSGREMVDRLSRLVGIFAGLNLTANRAEDDDLLGDAYEYLMRHFATESGKSKGQFYTPAEVSRVIARVIGIESDTQPNELAYDPTCGSGSLLLKVADEAPRRISIYGQEMDNATHALARMMRHLLDTYVRAEESRKLSTFDDLGLVDLLVDRGTSALDELPEGLRADEEAMSETIENNLRKVIIDEQPVNPKYYEKMSELLDALIQQRKDGAEDYETYLANLVDLSAQVKNPAVGGAYPASLNTSAKRSLYDNLDKDEAAAVRVDTAVRYTRKDDWRGNNFKDKEVLNDAVREELGEYQTRTEEIFELVKNQREY